MSDATLAALERSLDLRMRAHELHASNIANANVPGFKAKKIDFEARVRQALELLDKDTPLIARESEAGRAVASVTADIYEDPLARPNGLGNTVNIERENTEMAKNTIGYQTAMQLVNKKLAMQKYILSEAGR